MKQLQIKNIIGFVRVSILGENPETLLNHCKNAQITIWNINKVAAHHIELSVYPHQFKRLKHISEKYMFSVQMKKRFGLIHYLTVFSKKKEFIIAWIVSAMVLFLLSSIVWQVHIIGVTTEIETKMEERLRHYGIVPGAWIYSIDNTDEIQQMIQNDIPELLYVGIKKKGKTFIVEGIEKQLVVKENEPKKRHLVAEKNGVIEKMFIKRGDPVVRINDYVKRGDLLVSGELSKALDEGKEEEGERLIVAAEGRVYATTWYEVTVASSLLLANERLTGEQKRSFSIQIGPYILPLPSINQVAIDEQYREENWQEFSILGKKLPIKLLEKIVYNQNILTDVRTLEDAKQVAINEAINRLKLSLGQDAKIKKYYVLHETIDNGKVKLYLYISVLENIAKERLISP